MPVAFIDNDEGVHVDNVKSAVEQIGKSSGDEEPVIAFTNVNEKDIEQLLKNK